MRLTVGPFAGIAPTFAPHLLPPNAATTAHNCVMNSGELSPLNDATFVWAPTKTGTIQSIWRYQGTYWFHWAEDVDVVANPLANDPHERVYWTGEALPRMTATGLATTGTGTNYPLDWYTLGVPAPVATPVVTAAAPSNPANVQSRSYVYTYVSIYGEEGPPSPVATVFDTTDGDSVSVTLPSTGPTGDYNIVSKNVYRLNDGVWQFVETVAVAAASYTDTTLNAALGSGITSEEYDPPPTSLKGIIVMPGGFLAGFDADGNVCLSEPYLPHAWPVRYRVPFFGTIVAIKAFNNSILVTVRNEKPYLLTGSDPGAMYKEQFELGYGNLSKRGTVDMGVSVLYPCPDGLVVAGVGVADIVSKSVIDPRYWVSYVDPESFLSAKYGENYIWFSDNGSWIFNAKTGDLSTIGLTATAAYTDPGTGDLYLVSDGAIVLFDSGAPLEMTWESKDHLLARPTNFSRGRIRADGYPVTFEVFVDGMLRHQKRVMSKSPFTLPSGFLSEEWRYRVKTKNTVKTVTIANSVAEV